MPDVLEFPPPLNPDGVPITEGYLVRHVLKETFPAASLEESDAETIVSRVAITREERQLLTLFHQRVDEIISDPEKIAEIASINERILRAVIFLYNHEELSAKPERILVEEFSLGELQQNQTIVFTTASGDEYRIFKTIEYDQEKTVIVNLDTEGTATQRSQPRYLTEDDMLTKIKIGETFESSIGILTRRIQSIAILNGTI